MSKLIGIAIFLFANTSLAICPPGPNNGSSGRVLTEGGSVSVNSGELNRILSVLKKDEQIAIEKIFIRADIDGRDISKNIGRFRVTAENLKNHIIIERPCPPSG